MSLTQLLLNIRDVAIPALDMLRYFKVALPGHSISWINIKK